MNTSETISSIAAALAKAQASMGGAHKGAANPFYKSSYADLGSVIQALKEPFAANGISYVQFPSMADGMVTVTTRLMHSSGEWLEDTLALPLTKSDPQAVGSAISYGRRYSLQAIAGIPSLDDDGEAAMARNAPAAPPPQQTIDKRQLAQLEAAIDATQLETAKVLSRYRINSLAEMTRQQFTNAEKLLKDRAKAIADKQQAKQGAA